MVTEKLSIYQKKLTLKGGNVYHSVDIFKYKRKSWNGKGKNEASFKIKEDDDSLVDLINTLIAEIKALVPEK